MTAVKSLRGRDVAYKAKVSELKDMLSRDEQKVRELQVNMTDMRKKEEGWEEERKRLCSQLETEKTKSDTTSLAKEAEEEIKRWKTKAEESEEQCRELQEQMDARAQGQMNFDQILKITQSELEQSKVQNQKLEKEAKDATAALEEERTRTKSHEKELETARLEIGRLSHELRKRSTNNPGMCSGIGELSIPAQHQESNRLSARLRECETAARKQKAETVQWKEGCKKLKQEILAYGRENAGLKSELSAVMSKQKGCESAMEELREQLADAELVRDRNNEQSQMTTRESGEQIKRLEEDLIRTKQDLAEALNAMREFENEHMEFCGAFEKRMTFKEPSPNKSVYLAR